MTCACTKTILNYFVAHFHQCNESLYKLSIKCWQRQQIFVLSIYDVDFERKLEHATKKFDDQLYKQDTEYEFEIRNKLSKKWK